MARHAIQRFTVALLLAMLLLALGAVAMSRRIAEEEAVRDARVTAGGIARGLVSPYVDAGLRQGRGQARDRLRGVLDARLRDGSIAHVKVWSRDGRVLWSDQEQLIGRDFTLATPVLELFGTQRSVAELPDGEKPPRGGEPDEGDLLEVYVGARDSDGQPFVFETYTPRTRLASNRQVIFVELVPIGLAALLLLSLATLPLAISLARRVDRAHRHRAELMRHTLAAWTHERRRIAHDLHDDVVQDLAAVGYALPLITRYLAEDAPDEARAAGEHLSAVLSRALTSLRSVVGDLVPSELVGGGLAVAISEVATRAEERGVAVTVEVPEDLDLDPDLASLVYRIAREGLRNVIKHAAATTVTVSVVVAHGRIDVRVSDDGRGLGGRPVDTDRHVGLELLAEALREVGGEISVRDREGGGTVLAASMPAAALG